MCVLITQSCPTLCNPLDCSSPGSSAHGSLQARILEWEAILFFQGIFLTQGSNPDLLHCRQILYHLSHQRSSKLPYDPAIPLLGIYPEETKTEKDTCTPAFTAELFTVARTWRQTRGPSTDKWVNKLWYIYTMEYYSAVKKERI